MKKKIDEFKCNCSGCGNLWFYTETDLSQSQRNAAINQMKTGFGLLGCLPLLFIKGRDVIDYDRCPKCGSRSMTKETLTYEIDVPVEEILKEMSAQNAANIDPTSDEEYYAKAVGLYTMKKKTESIDILKKGLVLYPNSFLINSQIAFQLFMDKKYKESISFSEKSIEINPDDAGAWNTYGCCLSFLYRWDEALEAVIKASKLDPDNKQIEKNIKNIRKNVKNK